MIKEPILGRHELYQQQTLPEIKNVETDALAESVRELPFTGEGQSIRLQLSHKTEPVVILVDYGTWHKVTRNTTTFATFTGIVTEVWSDGLPPKGYSHLEQNVESKIWITLSDSLTTCIAADGNLQFPDGFVEQTGLTAEQVAVLGFAITWCFDVYKHADSQQSDPGIIRRIMMPQVRPDDEPPDLASGTLVPAQEVSVIHGMRFQKRNPGALTLRIVENFRKNNWSLIEIVRQLYEGDLDGLRTKLMSDGVIDWQRELVLAAVRVPVTEGMKFPQRMKSSDFYPKPGSVEWFVRENSTLIEQLRKKYNSPQTLSEQLRSEYLLESRIALVLCGVFGRSRYDNFLISEASIE